MIKKLINHVCGSLESFTVQARDIEELNEFAVLHTLERAKMQAGQTSTVIGIIVLYLFAKSILWQFEAISPSVIQQ